MESKSKSLRWAVTFLLGICSIEAVPWAVARADSGARTVQYSETEIIAVRAKVRFSTLIVLPANEEILDATTGDREFWIINGSHNLCYLHPAEHGIRSNLNLITSAGHVYSFLLTEVSNDPKAEPDLKIFVERKEESTIASITALPSLARASEIQAYKAAADTAKAESSASVAAAKAGAQKAIDEYRQEYIGKLAFDYSYNERNARESFGVAAIYHDDKFTYIKCLAQEKPTFYEIKDGKPDLVNFDVANGVYVIPTIVEHGYLVVGKKKLSFHRAMHGAAS